MDACANVWFGSLFCGAWNFVGDLCNIDFHLAHLTFEEFGGVDRVPRPSKFFNFNENWPLQLAQAGG